MVGDEVEKGRFARSQQLCTSPVTNTSMTVVIDIISEAFVEHCIPANPIFQGEKKMRLVAMYHAY